MWDTRNFLKGGDTFPSQNYNFLTIMVWSYFPPKKYIFLDFSSHDISITFLQQFTENAILGDWYDLKAVETEVTRSHKTMQLW